MRAPTTADFHQAFDGCTTIIADDRLNTDRIIRQLVTAGYWFFVRHCEGQWEITVSERIDLNRFKRRSPNIQFSIDSATL